MRALDEVEPLVTAVRNQKAEHVAVQLVRRAQDELRKRRSPGRLPQPRFVSSLSSWLEGSKIVSA